MSIKSTQGPFGATGNVYTVDKQTGQKGLYIGEPEGGVIATVWGGSAEAIANAHLLSSSFDLYQVCLGMRDLIDRVGVKVHAEFDEALNAAIAKAEGIES